MSQAANTFWDEKVERVTAAAESRPGARRRHRTHRLVDATILTIILAAAGLCVSVYSRANVELKDAWSKHEAAGEKVQDLTIRVEGIERDIERLRTDSRVIELLARQKFGFVRSGDVVIKLAPDPSDAADNGDSGGDSSKEERIVNGVKVANLTPRGMGGYTDASN